MGNRTVCMSPTAWVGLMPTSSSMRMDKPGVDRNADGMADWILPTTISPSTAVSAQTGLWRISTWAASPAPDSHGQASGAVSDDGVSRMLVRRALWSINDVKRCQKENAGTNNFMAE